MRGVGCEDHQELTPTFFLYGFCCFISKDCPCPSLKGVFIQRQTQTLHLVPALSESQSLNSGLFRLSAAADELNASAGPLTLVAADDHSGWLCCQRIIIKQFSFR